MDWHASLALLVNDTTLLQETEADISTMEN